MREEPGRARAGGPAGFAAQESDEAGAREARGAEASPGFLRVYGLYLAWVVAVVATLGSLYFSEVMGFIPCELCWWQRIFMYPQAIVLGLASYRDDRRVIPYVLPLSVIGGSISAFHYLQEKLPGLRLPVCGTDASCFTPWINWFGFVTIPFLALTAFVLIGACLWSARPQDEPAPGAAPAER